MENSSLTGGLGGMGGAQPLAATMNGALFLGVEVDPARIEKEIKEGYCDKVARCSLDEAPKLIDDARKDRQALSIGLVGNCADVLPEVVKRGIVPDILTKIVTSANDALNGYVPNGMTLDRYARVAGENPSSICYRQVELLPRWPCTLKRCWRYKERRGHCPTYGTTFVRKPEEGRSWKMRSGHFGFVPNTSARFGRRKGPFRCGVERRSAGHRAHGSVKLELFPNNQTLARWMKPRSEIHSISRAARAYIAGSA